MTPAMCANSGCSRAPSTTTHGTHASDLPEPEFDHSKYCSVQCSTKAADFCHVRSLERISNFMDKLFLAVGDATISWKLIAAHTTSQGVLQLVVQMKRQAGESSFQPYYWFSANPGERDTMISHNACRDLLRNYSGIIALLLEALELPLKAREINFGGVEVFQAIVLTMPGVAHCRKVASIHTMLEVTPSRPFLPHEYPQLSQFLGPRGLYMDITRRQYGYVPALVPVSTYPASETLFGRFDPEAIGAIYHGHLRQIHRSIQDPRESSLGHLKAEAIIRTVNNAFYHCFDTKGRRAIFSDFDDEAHEGTVSDIVDQVREDVEHLMKHCWEVNQMPLQQADVESIYKDIVRNCAGKGHTMVTTSLEKASGLQMAYLGDIR